MRICLLIITLLILACKNPKTYLFVGSYTSKHPYGIHVYETNINNNTYSLTDSVRISNASYLTIAANGKFVYAVNENEKGMVTAFAFDNKAGKLKLIDTKPTNGSFPCYISISPDGKTLAAGNYGSGSLTIFSINKDGSLSAATQTIQLTGNGPITERQASSHIHATVFSPDGHFLIAPDLGADKLWIFEKTDSGYTPAKLPFFQLPEGSGPRHLVFHKEQVFFTNELNGSLGSLDFNNGIFSNYSSYSLLPSDFTGTADAADIHLTRNGQFLYTSSRSSINQLTSWKLQNNIPVLIAQQYSGGEGPRNLSLSPDEHLLLSANQQSDEITFFERDTLSGTLTKNGITLQVTAPVCLKWLP